MIETNTNEHNTNDFDQETIAETVPNDELDALIQRLDEQESAEEGNPYRQAAIRLLTKYPEPTFDHVQHELNNL